MYNMQKIQMLQNTPNYDNQLSQENNLFTKINLYNLDVDSDLMTVLGCFFYFQKPILTWLFDANNMLIYAFETY